jgi:hypothetical protein
MPSKRKPARRPQKVPTNRLVIERVQTGARMEKRTLKVLKALAEYGDMSLGDLLEGEASGEYIGTEEVDGVTVAVIRFTISIASSNDMKGLNIESDQFGQFLMYRPNGRVMNSSVNGNLGEFTFCDSRGSTYAKVLIIDLSGRPRISRTLANGTSPVCS